MKTLLLIVCIYGSLWSNAQCTFEKFWPYYSESALTDVRLTLLKDGNFLLNGTLSKDTGVWEYYEYLTLTKVNACGNIIWLNSSVDDNNGGDDGIALETDDGNIILTGRTNAGLPGAYYNIRVTKHNSDGKLLKTIFIKGNRSSGYYNFQKNSYKLNSYLINGWTYEVDGNSSKPLMVEIDADLNVLKWKEFKFNELTTNPNCDGGSIASIFYKNGNSLWGECGVSYNNSSQAELYIAEFDSTFSVTQRKRVNRDSVISAGFFQNASGWSNGLIGTSIAGVGRLQFTGDLWEKDAFIKMGLDGYIQQATYFNDTLLTNYCISPTNDGGYITATRGEYNNFEQCYLHKLDSDFNTQWFKPVGGQITAVHQLPDGGYIATGLSNKYTQNSYYQLYLVRTDSIGNYVHTGMQEINTKLANVLLYPNPATSALNITTNSNTKCKAMLYNITGKLLYTSNTFTYQTQLNITAFVQGLYILKLVDENANTVYTGKVVIER